ncbi:alkene reductase [Paludibaculum fermentans]|uniref:alkene reductase n=1 Tax=Paludibaculum fermentans TaxID=1473598 RepID=UPI003EB94AC6
MPEQPGLFSAVKIGELELPNRIIMSPMTRIRAEEDCVPGERMVRYYSQRASAGLIITEGTHPSPMGRGYTHPPGLHTEAQAAGWRKVTDAVHNGGGRIVVQLMHAGRVSHSSLLPGGALPVAPSAIPIYGEIHTFDGKFPFETPRALETEEVPLVVEEYRRAAELSIAAGFDGVELHAATGYLPNQFQVTGSNQRTDRYGCSLEGRTRFTLELMEALCSVRGAGRVGIKIAPGFTVNDTYDEDPIETYTYLAQHLQSFGLAYVHVGYDSGYSRGTSPAFNPVDLIRTVYTGQVLAAGGFTKASGEASLAAGRADAIVYGRPFISNPDLVERFRVDAPLSPWDVRTFYGGDDHGYTDYPVMNAE